MSFKLLLWILVLGWIYHRWIARRRPPSFLFRTPAGNSQTPPSATSKTEEVDTQEMVQCAQCGVYLPREEALAQGNRWYCGPPHRQAGPRAES